MGCLLDSQAVIAFTTFCNFCFITQQVQNHEVNDFSQEGTVVSLNQFSAILDIVLDQFKQDLTEKIHAAEMQAARDLRFHVDVAQDLIQVVETSFLSELFVPFRVIHQALDHLQSVVKFVHALAVE